MKKCSKCKELLPLSRFAKCHGNTYLRPECRKCNSDATKVRNDIRKIHGMPTVGYICPICSGDEEEVGDISKRGQGAVLKGGQLPIQIKPRPGLTATKQYLKTLRKKRRDQGK